MDTSELTRTDQNDDRQKEPNKSKTETTIQPYLDKLSNTLGRIATLTERSYFEFELRLSKSTPYVASVMLGTVLILADLAYVGVNMFSRLPGIFEIVVLMSGVLIFLTGVISEAIIRLIILRGISQRPADISLALDAKLRELELTLKSGLR